MALRALAEAGRLLGRADCIDSARSLAGFLLEEMLSGGELRHSWRNSVLRPESYLSDHAQVGLGLLELHAATGEARWLRAAHKLAEQMVARFHEPAAGFHDGERGALPMRARDLHDGATPSAVAAACELLTRLAGAFERSDWLDLVQSETERQAALLEGAPSAVPSMLIVHLLSERGGELLLPAKRAFSGSRSEFAPLATLFSGAPDELPLARGRDAGVAYLCQHGSCQLPAATPGELHGQLGRLHRVA
jgi:uncharacterized protein YyaL (SSP411 family)